MSRSRPEQANAGLRAAEAGNVTQLRALPPQPLLRRVLDPDDLLQSVTPKTRAIVERRRAGNGTRRRGWLVRRLLVFADILALVAAFSATELLFGPPGPTHAREWLVLAVVLPIWIFMAKVYGLYDQDEARADHSTIDDAPGVFHLVTVGVWLLFIGGRLTGTADPTLMRLVGLWLLAIGFAVSARAVARAIARRSVLYLQNTVIVGAGDVGQLVARKVLQHPEAGINIVGFVDDHPRERRPELANVPLLGRVDGLPEIVEMFDLDRVIIAFSQDSEPRDRRPRPSPSGVRPADRRRTAVVRGGGAEDREPLDRGDAAGGSPARTSVVVLAACEATDRHRRERRSCCSSPRRCCS